MTDAEHDRNEEFDRRTDLDGLSEAANRLDGLAEMADFMDDADGANRLREAAVTARMRAMKLLDDDG